MANSKFICFALTLTEICDRIFVTVVTDSAINGRAHIAKRTLLAAAQMPAARALARAMIYTVRVAACAPLLLKWC